MGSHGDNVTLQDWGHHELDSHYERYGAEEYDHVKVMREFVAWLKKNNLEPSDVKGFTPDGHVILKPKTQRANYKPDVMFSAEECTYCGYEMAISPCCETSYCSCQDFDCDCEKHYDPTGDNYPDIDDETGERYGNWEWSDDYWYQPKNAESFSAEGKCDLFCNGKNDRDKGSLFCVPCMEEWEERMKKNKDFQNLYNPPEDYYRAEELKRDSCCCGATKSKPCACMILGVMECNATCPCALEKERNWGGDSQGQLATALRNARIKGKEPKKPLKIEKLDAETSGQWEIGEQLEEAQMNAEFEGNKLMVGSHDFDDGSMMVGVGTEDIGADDPDFMEMMIDKTGKIDYFSLPLGKDGFQRTYGVKPSHYGKMVTEKETNASKGGDFDRKHAEPYAGRTPEQQAILDERKRKLDYRLALGAKYPRKCSFCLAGIHKGLEDGSLTQKEFDTYMNDPMFPTEGGCERHDYWIAEEEYYHPDGEYDDGGGEMGCGPCQWYGDYDIGMAPAAEHTCIECEEGVCEGCYDSKTEMCLECAHDKATVKEAPKGIDTFTEPFEESSLDSGTAKSIVVGIGIGLLACFGYNKWK